MAEVIDLNQIQAQERRRREQGAAKRAAAVASALACGLCPRRCAYCGTTIESPVPSPPEAPYPFCSECLEEYRAFCRQGQGRPPEAFWHTPEWAQMWRTWLAFMKAGDEFRRSTAFLRLMEEHQD